MILRSLGIVLVIACLVADMATPLGAGAFRLDPADRVDGVGPRLSAARPPQAAPAPLPQQAPCDLAVRGPRPAAGDGVTPPPVRSRRPRAAIASIERGPGATRGAEDG
jgi:hypothetical protein